MKQLLMGLLLVSAMTTGCQKDKSVTDTPTMPKPAADFKILNGLSNGWVLEGRPLEIGNLSINADSYYWDFGNGMTSTDKIPLDISFSPCGHAYTITLVVKNKSGDAATISQTFTVQCSGQHP